MNETYAIIDLLGAVPGYFFAIIIGLKAKAQYANRTLVLGLLAYSSFLLSMFLYRLGYLEHAGVGHVHMNAFVHIAWPLFYFYLKAITSDIDTFSRKHLLHIAPFGLYLSLIVLDQTLFEGTQRVLYIASMVFTAGIAGGYTVAMFAILFGYRKRAANVSSEMTRLKLSWISTNIILWFVLVGVQVGFFLLRTFEITIPELAGTLHGLFINIATASWVYVIGYFAVSHPDILKLTNPARHENLPDGETEKIPNDSEDEAPVSKDSSQEIDQSLCHTIVTRLERVMEQQRPYLDNQLTLAKLAKVVNQPAYLVGRVINKDLNKNFLTYINEYRIEEVKRKLVSESYKDERILDIAFECGFRTKSAFNAFFKKHTGETPSDYRRRNSS